MSEFLGKDGKDKVGTKTHWLTFFDLQCREIVLYTKNCEKYRITVCCQISHIDDVIQCCLITQIISIEETKHPAVLQKSNAIKCNSFRIILSTVDANKS